MEKHTPNLLEQRWKNRFANLQKIADSFVVEAGVHSDASSKVKGAIIGAEFGNRQYRVPRRYPISKGLRDQLSVLTDPLKGIAQQMMRMMVGKKSQIYKRFDKLADKTTQMLQRRIRGNLPPPLLAATIAQKKSSGYSKPNLPLYATGEMYKALSGRVRRR